MGKILLLLVLGTTLTGTTYLLEIYLGANEGAVRHADRSYQGIAEDLAQSGYALGIQRLHESFEPFTEAEAAYGDGTFRVAASETSTGGMRLRSTGSAGGTAFPIEGEFVRLTRTCDLLGAVFLHTQLAPVVSLAGTGFSIRGEDTQPFSRTGSRAVLDGPGYTVAGLLADTLVSESFEVPLAGLGTLSADITLGGVTDEGYLRDLIGCLLQTAAAVLDESTATVGGSRTWVSQTFGSPTNPTLLVVEDDATFEGITRGYGVLLAGRNITARDDFVWEGLVLSVGNGPAAITLADSARVYGAVAGTGLPSSVLPTILRRLAPLTTISTLLDESGAITGALTSFRRPMVFSISDEAGIYASEEALGRLSDLLPALPAQHRIVVVNERLGIAARS